MELHRQRIPLEQIGRAILLGCVRKYVAPINHPGGTPVTSLHYFTILFQRGPGTIRVTGVLEVCGRES